MGEVVDIREELTRKRGSHTARLTVSEPVRQVPPYWLNSDDEGFVFPPQMRGSYPFPEELDPIPDELTAL